ncbi:MAG TPA: Rrf2 family transcriptional regulator [Bryobacteraceae bacterium]|nr:Rrf2 family transcriptional regulator [Bryobacteraceae bacterium]
MLKLTKKADYGLIALRHLTAGGSAAIRLTASAKDIAEAYRIPLPLLSKVLQKLARAGLLVSEQGTNGGYRLARDPDEISALDVIRTIDGPIILTHCFTEHEGRECDQTALCPVREPLRKVHEGILRLLSGITISDLASEDMQVPAIPAVVSGIQLSGVPPKRPNMESETNGI